MIYLDSSALMKLVRREDETDALRHWLRERLDDQDDLAVTSELGRVEVLRAARSLGGQVIVEARAVVGDLDLVPLDRAVQDVACDLDGRHLRTLDALHLASALLLGAELTAFVAYDHPLIAAAKAVGLPVSIPDHRSQATEDLGG